MIVLVPESYGENEADKSPGLFQPELTRIMQQSVVTKMRLDVLVEELRAAGILQGDAVARINAERSVLPFGELREFHRANNVDDFFE